MTNRHTLLVPLFMLLLSFADCGWGGDVDPCPSIVGIDHIPTAVKNLDQASETYRKLGFALKPGRFHEDGLHNAHVKFEDGSGIELISPPVSAQDDLTAHYIEFLRQGDGPAYIGFHVRDTDKLRSALKESGLKIKAGSDGLEPDEPLLDYLFIDQDNRAPSDRPEHFANENSAYAMTGVWLAMDDARQDRLTMLLMALGTAKRKERVLAPRPVDAIVFAVQNGRVVVLSKSHQLHDGRPIVGMEFRVHDIGRTSCGRDAKQPDTANSAKSRTCLVPPANAQGMWLEFHQ